ncbi:MAG: cytochrome b [Gallionella sp.]
MTTRYTKTAIWLHWLMVLPMFAVFPLGLYMHELKLSPAKLQLYSYHKWIGITLLMLAVLRVLWRLTHTPPPLPDSIARWQKIASSTVHHMLYVLLLIVPLSGWLMSSAKGVQTVWFGVLPLPDLVTRDKALGHLLENVHESLNYLLLLLVAAHIAAALKHKLIDRDEVMARMLPKGNKP